jgi:uncharacterized protein with gpF-like domain
VKLVAPNKSIALPALPPSAAVLAWYYEQLQCLIESMAQSMEYHVAAAYRSNDPEIGMATDERSQSLALKRSMNRWGRNWVSKFDRMAVEIATKFAGRAHKHVDMSNAAAFKKAGFTVKFSPTPASIDAYQATLAQNVALIKSLPREYIAGIENAVWASVLEGRNLDSLTTVLRQRYGMTLRRAALISRDQNRKATALIENVRRSELGITHAIWLHSHAVKTPRPSHKAFSGHVYELKKGAYLDGKWVWPGTEINCRCLSRAIIPGVNDDAIRRVVERERARV